MPLLKPNVGTGPDSGDGQQIRNSWIDHNTNADILQALLTASGIPESQPHAGISAQPAPSRLLTDNAPLRQWALDLEAALINIGVLSSPGYAASTTDFYPQPGDTLETAIGKLHYAVAKQDEGIRLAGIWDATTGTFPAAGTAQDGTVRQGDMYIVTGAGTVGGEAFEVDNRVVALVDGPSTTVYAANWFRRDYSADFETVNVPLAADDNVGSVGTLSTISRSDARAPLQTRLGGSETTLTLTSNHALTPADLRCKRIILDYPADGMLTLPDDADAVFGDGDVIELINVNTGRVTVTPQTGKNLNNVPDATRLIDVVPSFWTLTRSGATWWIEKIGGTVSNLLYDTAGKTINGSVSGTAYTTQISGLNRGDYANGDFAILTFGAGDNVTGILGTDSTGGLATDMMVRTGGASNQWIRITPTGELQVASSDAALGISRIQIYRGPINSPSYAAGTLVPTVLDIDQDFSWFAGGSTPSGTFTGDGSYRFTVEMSGVTSATTALSIGVRLWNVTDNAQVGVDHVSMSGVVGAAGDTYTRIVHFRADLAAGKTYELRPSNAGGLASFHNYNAHIEHVPASTSVRAEDWDVTNYKDYVTSERDTGRLSYDGKPIFSVSFNGAGLSNGDVAQDLLPPGTIMRIEPETFLSLLAADGVQLPIPLYDGTINSRFWKHSDGRLQARSNWSSSGAHMVHGTVYYTKS